MYRVLVATFLAAVTVMVTGCTGSLRLGSSIHVVEAARSRPPTSKTSARRHGAPQTKCARAPCPSSRQAASCRRCAAPPLLAAGSNCAGSLRLRARPMTSRSGTSPPGFSSSGLAALANGAVLSPFTQLRRLLGATPAGHAEPIDLTIGEPREAMPPFVVEKLLEAASGYASYPPIRGTAELRAAISAWSGRRYGAAGSARPRPRSFAHKWLARRAFPRRAARRRTQAGAGPTSDPDVQSLLQRLHRRRAGGQRRAGLPQRNASDRASAGS